MKKRNVAAILALAIGLGVLSGCAAEKAPEIAPGAEGPGKISFQNPIRPAESADPWVTWHDGFYYYCYSYLRQVHVVKAKNLYEIGTEKPALVYTPPIGDYFSSDYWAPEIHYINGKWYIYVAADDGKNENHRMIVLEAKTDDPQGEYVSRGKITDPSDKWAIDGTVLSLEDRLYFVWSGWEGDVNVAQNLYIAPMSDPYTISGDRVLLSRPELPWETVGEPRVNEAPQALVKNGKVHIVYSASGSWTDDYCLGMLTLEGKDPLDAAAWKKSEEPVFSKTEGAYGPGHCSFTTSPDGREDWIVYHANELSGSGWTGRSIRAQPFAWDGDTPLFGKPVPLDTTLWIPENTGKPEQ